MINTRSHRFVSSLAAAGVIAFAPIAGQAQVTITDDARQSNFSGNVYGPGGGSALAATAPINSDNSAGVPADPFNYAGSSFAQLLNITSISITVTIFGGNTEVGGTDRGALTLALDNIDTGLLLNGFGTTRQDTLTISGTPNNAAAILAALQADGMLNARIFDSTGSVMTLASYNNLTVPALEEDETTPIFSTLAVTGVVPEPGSVALLTMGLVSGGLLLRRRRRQQTV